MATWFDRKLWAWNIGILWQRPRSTSSSYLMVPRLTWSRIFSVSGPSLCLSGLIRGTSISAINERVIIRRKLLLRWLSGKLLSFIDNTRWPKKWSSKILSISSPNIDRFLKFFILCKKFVIKWLLNIPPHLNCVDSYKISNWESITLMLYHSVGLHRLHVHLKQDVMIGDYKTFHSIQVRFA